MSHLDMMIQRKNARQALEAAAETAALAAATRASKAADAAWDRTIAAVNRARVEKPADKSGWSTAIQNAHGRVKT